MTMLWIVYYATQKDRVTVSNKCEKPEGPSLESVTGEQGC